MFKPKGEKALWKLVYEYVVPLKLGQLLTYEDLSEAADQDIKLNRSLIYTANKHLLKDLKRMLVVERGIGYKIVDGLDIMDNADMRQIRAKRRVSLAHFETKNINTVKLTPDEKDKLQKFMAFNANIRAAFVEKIENIEKASQVSDLIQQLVRKEIEGLKGMVSK